MNKENIIYSAHFVFVHVVRASDDRQTTVVDDTGNDECPSAAKISINAVLVHKAWLPEGEKDMTKGIN
jgi:hypothetical protein